MKEAKYESRVTGMTIRKDGDEDDIQAIQLAIDHNGLGEQFVELMQPNISEDASVAIPLAAWPQFRSAVETLIGNPIPATPLQPRKFDFDDDPDIPALLAEIDRLRKQLDTAPHWVHVSEYDVMKVDQDEYVTVWGRIGIGEIYTQHDACYVENVGWLDGRGEPVKVTHVLANLNSPASPKPHMQPNSTECLANTAAKENNGSIVAGGCSCDVCCDTGCEVDPTKPIVNNESDCLVPCSQCEQSWRNE